MGEIKNVYGTVLAATVGQAAMIYMHDGHYLRTSTVQHMVEHPDKSVDLITKNSHYRVFPCAAPAKC